MKTRNPLFGGIIAAIMIGFGSWRLYNHFVVGLELETWRLLIAGAAIVYGIFVGYNILTQKNEK